MNEQLRSVIADALDLEPAEVTPELTRGSDAVAWDSMGHLRLITAVEETFDIRLSMDEIEGITTAAELDGCVTTHTANK
ncbi:acyl carrier protein [Salinisphaera sp.]|uniref:acyl carrier protein n=1 Tax=Salinisphaera sp. TaxID=1914330 RepID=UPI002D7765D4|nr:acyl carrier protein [Salinisphaera sp.]HET7314096.1 acyl carrier protein [Salinisphaera sp.]